MKLYRVKLYVAGSHREVEVIAIANTPEGAYDTAETEAMDREQARCFGSMSDVVEVILDSPRIVAYEA